MRKTSKAAKNQVESGRLQSEVAALRELLEVYEQKVAEQSERLERAMSALKGFNEELTRSETELRRSAEELKRSNQELEQFAYVASHDLQEPLRMVASYCDLLQRRYKGKLDAEAEEFIAFAVDGARSMQGFINDLLAYSRVGTRGGPFGLVDSSLSLKKALANLEVPIRQSGAKIIAGDLPLLAAEPALLTQVFQNLIGNAIKFRGSKIPDVHVNARLQGKEWVFSVQDNGIGIAPENLDSIFVIFNRLHTREEYPGTGIGLAICKKIIERHRGRIWVESEFGKGSTFFFSLPAASDQNARKSP